MGFCSRVEWMSPLTSPLTLPEANNGHFSTVAMPSPLLTRNYPTPSQSDSARSPGDDRTHHDARPGPLGGPGRELPYGSTLFRHGATVGHAVLGVLPAPWISV